MNRYRSTFRGALRLALGVAVAGALVLPSAASADPASANPIADAAQALSKGDGSTAAAIIREQGYEDEPAQLADIIYDAGVIAIEGDTGDAFSDGLPIAYLRGGVTLVNAEASFLYAVLNVVGRSVNFDTTPRGTLTLLEQGKAGALAVLKTQSAYFGVNLGGGAGR